MPTADYGVPLYKPNFPTESDNIELLDSKAEFDYKMVGSVFTPVPKYRLANRDESRLVRKVISRHKVYWDDYLKIRETKAAKDRAGRLWKRFAKIAVAGFVMCTLITRNTRHGPLPW